ncbi:MAG: Holliday junction resolvase RuvX [Promicromonosporaceae bacterium]|nr:Holliday junction resolvase RuvX [Promicromonosporaceae bacterium]
MSANLSGPRLAKALPRGARLGVDVGTVRIGLAKSDPDGLLATPVETVARAPGETGSDSPDVARIVAVASEYGAAAIYVGLPRHLSGAEGAATADARAFAARLVAALPDETEVRLIDERLTTVSASSNLRASGRSSKSQRGVIDQAAAVILLQSALDIERNAGRRAGTSIPN